MRGFAGIAVAIAVMVCGLAGQPAMAQKYDKQLDDASLQTMAEGLGYETKPLDKGVLITYKRDTWTLYVQLVLSSDGTKLGMNANLGQIADMSAVSSDKWIGLLVDNGTIDPSTFYVDKDQKKLYLHRVMDNRGITSAILRSQLDSFTSNLIDTEGDWDFVE